MSAGQQLTGRPPQTAGWADFRDIELGNLRLDTTGKQVRHRASARRRKLEGDQSSPGYADSSSIDRNKPTSRRE